MFPTYVCSKLENAQIQRNEVSLCLYKTYLVIINSCSSKFIPQQLPARRLTEADYQHITEIWETSGKHYEHELHILHTLFLHVLRHP